MRTQEEEEREGMRQSEPDRALLREKGLDPFVTMPVHNDDKLKPVFCNKFSQLNKMHILWQGEEQQQEQVSGVKPPEQQVHYSLRY